MPLTDTALRSAKAQAKVVKLFDGGGLYLEVSSSGGNEKPAHHKLGNPSPRFPTTVCASTAP